MIVPHISTIEFTNACNFTCSYCQRYHEVGKRKVGMLSVELVKRMIKNGSFDNTIFCEFQQNGEPTIHPHFEEIAKLIKTVVPKVGMSTNGTFHSFKHLKGKEIDYLDAVTISVHPETTEEDIDKTIGMLKNCKIRIQTLSDYVYKLNINKYKGVSGIYIDNYELRDFNKTYKAPKFCLDVLASVTIQWDGDVVPCCNTVGKQKVYGNVKNKSLKDIWASADKTMFNFCKTCNTPSPYAKRLEFLSNTLNS